MARKLGYRFGRARVREAATTLLRQAPAVLRLFGRLMTDRRVSVVDRGLVAAVLAYVISPFDLIPDFLTIIGVVDDLFLMGIALERLLMRAPRDVVEDHWVGTPEGLDALTAELQAIGHALPGPIRSILHGRVGDASWGRSVDAAEVFASGEEAATDWAPAQRAGADGLRRGVNLGADDFDDMLEDDDDDDTGAERVDRYRSRL